MDPSVTFAHLESKLHEEVTQLEKRENVTFKSKLPWHIEDCSFLCAEILLSVNSSLNAGERRRPREENWQGSRPQSLDSA